MKKITAKGSTVADVFAVLAGATPKELQELKDGGDYARTVTRFAKLTDKFELPAVKAARIEQDALTKAIRAEVKPYVDGKTPEEVEIIAKPFNERLTKGLSDIAEKHGLDKLSETDATVELSDEEHSLLTEALPKLGATRFNSAKPFAAALEAVSSAVEA